MNVKNFILRKLVGEQNYYLSVEQVQKILESQEDDDRIFRAIFNSSMSHKKSSNIDSHFDIQAQTPIGQSLLIQVQHSLQSIKHKTLVNSNEQFEIDLNSFNQEVSEAELLKQQLQNIYRLYKATIRLNGNGLMEVNNYLQNLSKTQILIDNQFSINCYKSAPLFIQGVDQFEQWNQKSQSLYNQVIQTRQIIKNSKVTFLQKSIKIVEKYKSIQRIKYTLEKLIILKQTFGHLAQAINKYDDNAYELIPIMKETQNNINKYKLNELKLSCVNVNFFENKIENLKEKIKEGIQQNFQKFDEKKYYSLLKSYYYIEKHYQMQPFVTQIWGLAKKSISQTFKATIQKYEQSYKPAKIYQNISEEDLLQFYKVLYCELVELMLNFHYCNRFHQEHECEIEQIEDKKQFEEYADQIRQSYLEMRQLIWKQIQHKIKKIIQTHQFNIKSLIIEHLIYFLGYNCLLIKRAEDFSHSDSESLSECIRDTFSQYIQQFHKNNIKQISTYLQNELYQRLPLTRDSKLIQHLNQINNLNFTNKKIFEYLIIKREENYAMENKKNIDFQDLLNNDKEMQLFYLFEYQNPFILQQDEFEMIIKAFWCKKQGSQATNVLNNEAVLTSSSLRIFELLPQYVQLAHYHPECQQNVIANFIQLIELFMFVSYDRLVGQTQQKQIMENFQQVMKFDENREIEFFINYYDLFSDCLVLQERFCNVKRFLQRFLKERIDFKEIDYFQNKEKKQFVDIAERAIASETINYLLQQIKNSFNSVGIHSQQFDVIKEVYFQFKEFLYKCFVQAFIKIDGIVQFVPQQRWELRDLHNENNSLYLDRLLQFILDQREKLRSIGGGVIPSTAQKDIFSFLAEHCLNILLETYGKIKRLNSVGREQMIMEFTTCCQTIENSSKSESETILRQKISLIQIEYLRVFNSSSYEEVDQFIQRSKTQIPLRLLHNLMLTCPSYVKLSKQQKKDIQTKFFREYYDTFRLF